MASSIPVKSMTYERAAQLYITLRDANKAIMDEAEALVVQNKEKMQKLGVWMQLKAEGEKLDTVRTNYATVFWTEGATCTLANSEEFFKHVIEHQAWDLLEKRVSKTGVKDYLEQKKELPPGVNYATFKQINVRAVKQKGA